MHSGNSRIQIKGSLSMRTNALQRVFDKLNAMQVEQAQAVIEAQQSEAPGAPEELPENAFGEATGRPDMVPPGGRPDVPAAVEFDENTGLPTVAMEHFPDPCRGECEDEYVDDLAML